MKYRILIALIVGVAAYALFHNPAAVQKQPTEQGFHFPPPEIAFHSDPKLQERYYAKAIRISETQANESDDKLISRIKAIDTAIETENLITRANDDSLDEADRARLAEYLAEADALHSLRAQHLAERMRQNRLARD